MAPKKITMTTTPKTIILRHRRENLKKCSLRGLETRDDMDFYTYPNASLPDLTGYILLDMTAPVLSRDDAGHGIFLIDATWRYAEVMLRQIPGHEGFIRRSLPVTALTAYPRRQDDCIDPARGLASIEALFIAYAILGYDTNGLLDNYHWKERFLKENAALIASASL